MSPIAPEFFPDWRCVLTSFTYKESILAFEHSADGSAANRGGPCINVNNSSAIFNSSRAFLQRLTSRVRLDHELLDCRETPCWTSRRILRRHGKPSLLCQPIAA
jgi:hypothetical protein